jgi:hypothetical protein
MHTRIQCSSCARAPTRQLSSKLGSKDERTKYTTRQFRRAKSLSPSGMGEFLASLGSFLAKSHFCSFGRKPQAPAWVADCSGWPSSMPKLATKTYSLWWPLRTHSASMRSTGSPPSKSRTSYAALQKCTSRSSTCAAMVVLRLWPSGLSPTIVRTVQWGGPSLSDFPPFSPLTPNRSAGTPVESTGDRQSPPLYSVRRRKLKVY